MFLFSCILLTRLANLKRENYTESLLFHKHAGQKSKPVEGTGPCVQFHYTVKEI